MNGNITVAINMLNDNETIENILYNNISYTNVRNKLVLKVENKCNDIVPTWENKTYINEKIDYKLATHSIVVPNHL